MAAHESGGLHYIGLNDGHSVRQWIFNKQTIDQAAVDHARRCQSRGTGPPNHPDRTGGLHVPPINAGMALK